MNFSADWLYWLIIFSVCAVNILLVYVAWWALFSDRSKGRRRCPQCWYDLAYSPGMTCAECGFTGTNEKQFHTSRRRYKIALAAILCSVAISGYVSDRLSLQGWAAHLPTSWLMIALPWTDDFNNALGRELVTRATTGQMSREQWLDLLDRCAAGDWNASPVTDDWIDKYGWFLNANRRSLRKDSEMESLLDAIPPRLEVRTAPVWPIGANPVAMVQVRDWWPWGMECRIRATPRAVNAQGSRNAAQPFVFYRSGDDRIVRSPFALSLPAIDESTTHFTVEFEIDRRRSHAALEPGDSLPQWEHALTQTVTLPVRALNPGDVTLEPVDSLSIASTLARVFSDSPVRFTSSRSPVRFRMATNSTDNPAFDDIALGMSVELLHHDQLARQLNVWWLGGVITGDRRYGYEVAFESPNLAELTATDEPGAWSLRIRGNRDIALRTGAGTKYWNGELNIPVELSRANGPTPGRAWWTESDVPPEEPGR